MVDAELSTELNEDRIAPNRTAAKKPMTGLGNNGGNQRRISEVDRGGTGRRQLVLNGRQVVKR